MCWFTNSLWMLSLSTYIRTCTAIFIPWVSCWWFSTSLGDYPAIDGDVGIPLFCWHFRQGMCMVNLVISNVIAYSSDKALYYTDWSWTDTRYKVSDWKDMPYSAKFARPTIFVDLRNKLVKFLEIVVWVQESPQSVNKASACMCACALSWYFKMSPDTMPPDPRGHLLKYCRPQSSLLMRRWNIGFKTRPLRKKWAWLCAVHNLRKLFMQNCNLSLIGENCSASKIKCYAVHVTCSSMHSQMQSLLEQWQYGSILPP